MKNKKMSVLTVILCVIAGGMLAAQEYGVRNTNATEPLSLTVEDAVSYALTNNKSLKSAAIDLEIKKRASQNSWNTFLPSASLSGTLSRNNAEKNSNLAMLEALGMGSAEWEDEADRWSAIGVLGLQWNFNIAMVESIKIAKKQYESGQISWEQTARETEVNIRKMFYGLLLAQENLAIQKESLDNAESRWKQAEINYRNGIVPRLSMLNAKVTYENKKPTLLSAEQSLKQNKELFGFLLGLPYGREFDLVGSIEFSYTDIDADEIFKKYIDQNKDIQALKKNKEILELSIRAKNLATFTPSLSVGYTFQPYVGDITASNWFDKDNYTETGTATITLAYQNLFNMLPWSSNMQGIKDLKQQYSQIQLGLEQLYQNAEIEVHKLVDNLNVAKENIEAMERNVGIAQEAYESTLKAYNAGTQERLELQDSETQLNQAKLGLMNEKYNYVSALLDLETKLNISLR